jgi:undecaprenyl-diphosphatase
VGWRDSIAIGVAQAIAVFAGVSRSGAAITTARAAGIKREDSADFAFLLSVPIIAAAGGYAILELALEGMSGDLFWNMLVGGIAAALTGYFAIQFLLRHLGRGGYRPYAVYRLCFAALLLILYFTL